MSNKSQTIVINLFGEPCVGKSGVAAELFGILKKHDINAGLALEYAKDLVYEQRTQTLEDQLYLLAEQNRRIGRMCGQVDVIVCDSPLILAALYSKPGYFSNFDGLVRQIFNSYTNRNFLLSRDPTHAYQQTGRYQTEQQANTIRDNLLRYLQQHNIETVSLVSTPNVAQNIFNYLCSKNTLAPKE